MKNLWQSYKDMVEKNRKSSVLDDISIANDEVALLAKRLEFFLPEFSSVLSLKETSSYILAWSMFLSILLTPSSVFTFSGFLENVIVEFFILAITIFPSFAVLDTFRNQLKKLRLLQATLRIASTFIFFSTIAFLLVYSLQTIYHGDPIVIKIIAYQLLKHIVLVLLAVIILLFYFMSRHRELLILMESFELKLATQNELFNARMSPHFFFNTINGLISLVESKPTKAVEMLSNISTLFRASFDDTAEISFDEEVELCKVFLAIDEMRFQGKLNVTWDLPDEDLMYDMVITSLTLQSVLEKVLHHVVELTTQVINVNIWADWEHHQVDIVITIDLPTKTLLIRHDLHSQMDFEIQAQRLQYYFGENSTINTRIADNEIEVTISYPLHDPNVSLDASLENVPISIPMPHAVLEDAFKEKVNK